MRYRHGGLSTYGLDGLRHGDEHPRICPFGAWHYLPLHLKHWKLHGGAVTRKSRGRMVIVASQLLHIRPTLVCVEDADIRFSEVQHGLRVTSRSLKIASMVDVSVGDIFRKCC